MLRGTNDNNTGTIGINQGSSKQNKQMFTLLENDLSVAISNRQVSVPAMSDLYQYLILMTSFFLKLSLPPPLFCDSTDADFSLSLLSFPA